MKTAKKAAKKKAEPRKRTFVPRVFLSKTQKIDIFLRAKAGGRVADIAIEYGIRYGRARNVIFDTWKANFLNHYVRNGCVTTLANLRKSDNKLPNPRK